MRQLALAVVIALGSFAATVAPAAAAGNVIQVNTTEEGEFPADGKCSLEAAIKASNTSALAGYCPKPGTADVDTIFFNLGSGVPVIALTADLPAITAPVIINGHSNGATQVRLEGPGSGTGLNIQASGTTIEDTVIDGFFTGVSISGTSGVILTGNAIGPNSDAGILVAAGNSNVQIGGTNDPNPGSNCDDDCNLISGNTRAGIDASGSGTIEGNYLGTNLDGSAARANGLGLLVTGNWTIGGDTLPARNLISGNTGDGLQITQCTCTVEGNYIGSDISGQHRIANGSNGIDVNRALTSTIGGAGYGRGNLISANMGNGINIDTDQLNGGATLTIWGNKIGTSQSGKTLGNGGDGIYIGAFAPQAVVGSPVIAHAGNTIAFNGGDGVHVSGADQADEEIRGNSIYNNTAKGIALDGGANGGIAAPTITSVLPLKGTTCSSCQVDIYSDKVDEGRTYQGTVTADSGGNWKFTGTVYGPEATATSTGANHNTSEFSAPVAVNGGGGGGAYQPDGRINKFTSAYLGNDIYNADGTNQTKSGTAKIGYIVEFHLSLQNDGDSSDSFKVTVDSGSSTMYRIKYYRGSTDITTKVNAGTYLTPSIASGGTLVLTVDVIVKKEATVNSSISRLVTITSVNDSGQFDALKFIAARK